MRILLGISGAVILGYVLMDLLITTLTLEGGGPIVNNVSSWIWKTMLRHRRCASSQHLLSLTGLTILLTTPALWIGLTWLSWLLIFNVSNEAVVNSTTGRPADFWARAYYTGYSLFTLGLGDIKPEGAVWQILTVVASANGFLLVSLIITYLLSVISAATQQRQLTGYISSLGKTSEEIIVRAWNGYNFGLLEQHLVSLTPMVVLHGYRHLTYPALHYFYSVNSYTSLAVTVAILDETLTLLKYGIEPANQIDAMTMYAARQAVTGFLDTLSSAFIEPAAQEPPMPSLDRLRAGGVPTVSDEEFELAIAKLCQRRRLLLGLVQNHAWSWDDVCQSRNTSMASFSELAKRKRSGYGGE